MSQSGWRVHGRNQAYGIQFADPLARGAANYPSAECKSGPANLLKFKAVLFASYALAIRVRNTAARTSTANQSVWRLL